MLVFGAIFYTTFIANHYYFRTFTFDYAVYNFAFWDYSHFHVSADPIYYVCGVRQKTLLQDHFSFILMYFVPVYWLLNWFTGSYTLMIIQVTMVLISAGCLYKLIKLKTGDDWLGVISVLYYFLLQGHYSSFNSDCNIYTLAFCLIPPFLLCFEFRKYGLAFILFMLFLFSREDMPLYAIFIFAVLLIWHRKERRIVIYCLSGMVLSVCCFLLIFKMLIPAIDTSQVHYDLFQYSALGNTPGEALMHCIKHPLDTFRLLYKNQSLDHTFDNTKKELYMVYLISGAFLLLLRPQYIIWFIPILAQKMFNDASIRWGITGFYCDGIITLLPISVFLSISVFKRRWIRYSLASTVCVLALSVTWYKMDVNNRVTWDDTVKENIFNPGFFYANFDAEKIHTDLKLIPPDAKVCASEALLPHLSQRKDVYEFPDVEDAEYLAVFTFHNYYLIDEKTYAKVLDSYILNPSWKMIAYDPPFLLMKRIGPK